MLQQLADNHVPGLLMTHLISVRGALHSFSQTRGPWLYVSHLGVHHVYSSACLCAHS